MTMDMFETSSGEAIVITQVRLNALCQLLADKGIITEEEFKKQLQKETEKIDELIK